VLDDGLLDLLREVAGDDAGRWRCEPEVLKYRDDFCVEVLELAEGGTDGEDDPIAFVGG
jgi:hypothetical protein